MERPATAGTKRKNGFDLENFVNDVGQIILEMDAKIKQLESRLGKEEPNVMNLEAEQSYYEEIQPIPPPRISNKLAGIRRPPTTKALDSARIFHYTQGKDGQILRDII